jgi:hypothetical protein
MSALAAAVVLAILALATVALAGAAFSVLLGGIAAVYPRTRWAAPFLLFMVPAPLLLGLVGFFGVGGMVVANTTGYWQILGPLLGLAGGVLVGLAVGTTLAALAWMGIWMHGQRKQRAHPIL